LLIQFLLLLNLGDNWQDIKDKHGCCLVIGEFHFAKREVEGFSASNECRDVFAAMELSGKLLLEEHSVHESFSNICDSLMKVIKMTSSPGPDDGPINNNSFGGVNKKFIRFFIDMLSLQLAFDNWYVSIRILKITCDFAQFKLLIDTTLSGTHLLHRWRLRLKPKQLPLRLPMLFSITNRFWFH
jgi:hypothetical protein